MKLLRTKLTHSIVLVVALMLIPSGGVLLASSHTSSSNVFSFDGAAQPGATMVVRSKNGIAVSWGSSGTGVIAGDAVTLWVVIFNRPENCAVPWQCGEDDIFVDPGPPETDIYLGGGNVIGGNATIHVSGRVSTHDDPHFGGAFGGGFTNPKGAEVHLVLRSHGPKVAANMPAQINDFFGGCDVFLDPPAIPEAVGECSDVQFSIHPSPDAGP